jgi:hypothetical protein
MQSCSAIPGQTAGTERYLVANLNFTSVEAEWPRGSYLAVQTFSRMEGGFSDCDHCRACQWIKFQKDYENSLCRYQRGLVLT